MSDLVILSLGAGVQSSVLALMACRGELHPKPDHIMFADTGDEPAAVYEHLEWLKLELEKSGLKITTVSGGSIREDIQNILYDTSDKAGRIGQPPFYTLNGSIHNATQGKLLRKCTTEYKIAPMTKKIRELVGLKKGMHFPKDVRIIKLLGISLDEVIRMKPSPFKWEEILYPLIDLGMTRWDCFRWLKQHEYPTPPRSACMICPFHSNDHWREMKRSRREEFDSVCDFDDELRVGKVPKVTGKVYLHRYCVPLREIDFDNDIDRGQGELDLWGGECEGLCGT